MLTYLPSQSRCDSQCGQRAGDAIRDLPPLRIPPRGHAQQVCCCFREGTGHSGRQLRHTRTGAHTRFPLLTSYMNGSFRPHTTVPVRLFCFTASSWRSFHVRSRRNCVLIPRRPEGQGQHTVSTCCHHDSTGLTPSFTGPLGRAGLQRQGGALLHPGVCSGPGLRGRSAGVCQTMTQTAPAHLCCFSPCWHPGLGSNQTENLPPVCSNQSPVLEDSRALRTRLISKHGRQRPV